jgi:hypothetical protein
MVGERGCGDSDAQSDDRSSQEAPNSDPGMGARWGNARLFAAGFVGCLGLGLVLLLGLASWSDESGSDYTPALLSELPAAVIESAPGPRRDVAASMATFRAPAGLPILSEVSVADQGIAIRRPLQPNVYLLQQMSTGRYITDQGRLVLVDDSGRRLLAPPTIPSE